MIKPWIFEFIETFQPLGADMPAEHYAGVYDWHFDLWAEAEDIGFEGIFFSEHHFVRGRLMPSPHLLISAVAMRTSRLRLGVMGSVLPLHHPWRLAEEAAMLDLITHGRYELGLSSGAHPNETAAIGLPPEEVRPRFNEGIDIVEKALTQKVFSHHGRFWQFEDLSIFPQPMQQPMPPRWITGVSEGAAENAARRGHKLCTGFLDVGRVKAIFDAYSATAAAAGTPGGPAQLGLRRQIFLADSESEAREVADNAAKRIAADKNAGPYKGKLAAPPRSDESTKPAEPTGHTSAAPDAPTGPGKKNLFDGKDETITGPPALVAEKIIEQCRTTGAGHILAYPFQAVTKAQMTRNYQLWREVIPALRRAGVA